MTKTYKVGTAPREAWWAQQGPRKKALQHLALPAHRDAVEVFGDALPVSGYRPRPKGRNG